MKRREFVIGAGAVAGISAMPGAGIAHVPAAYKIASLLRAVAASGWAATAPNWRDPDRCTYLLAANSWVVTMHRCQYPWEVVAFVEDATAPDGCQINVSAWGAAQDPIALLTPEERCAFDRIVVADMIRWKR